MKILNDVLRDGDGQGQGSGGSQDDNLIAERRPVKKEVPEDDEETTLQ
jgi:hypothetical protein